VLFDTPVYVLFLAIVVFVYWSLRWRRQNALLLIASYFFYGWWDWRFLILILISTLVDFFCAKAIAATENVAKRRLLLTTSLLLNLTFLGFFKYYDFFIQSFAAGAGSLGVSIPFKVLAILLPPGISFYTFQEVAYIVDVYHRKLEPAESLVDYALFITLFPHLIAGPIQRPSHLLPQVQKPRVFDASQFSDGIMLILSGLFRKAVVADNCALLANAAFSGKLGEPNLPVLLIGAYAFAWQIYGDFSGYSDMARGSAQLLGFHFMVNFRQPYLSRSIQEFWRRWHISLSTWLRDYLYIPLGGSRHGEGKTYRNLIATMLLGGLWHGANWTFVVWGAIHGGWLALERLFRGSREPQDLPAAGLLSPGAWLQRIVVFHLICVTWIFFRAQSVGAAFHLLAAGRHWGWRPEYAIAAKFLAVFTVPLFALDLILELRQEEYVFATTTRPLRLAAATAFAAAVTLFAANEASAFIYFQF
jgi:alginate O-acetyltransferase complex protein AlgI